MVATVNAVKSLLDCPTAEAKSIVHESTAWSYGKDRREQLWSQLDSMIKSIGNDNG